MSPVQFSHAYANLLPNNWFRLRGPVGRFEYAIVGFGLALLKYLIEFAVIAWLCHQFYTPLDFISPFLTSRQKYLSVAPDWLGWAWLLWTLPFLWIGVCMSVRRAFDAGASPWIGMVILVPFANLVCMILLAMAPSRSMRPTNSASLTSSADSVIIQADVIGDMYKPPMLKSPPIEHPSSAASEMAVSAILGLTGGGVYLLLSVLASVYLLGSYGAAMFFGAPIMTCAISAYFLNRHFDFGLGKTIVHAIATLLFASLAFLIFAIEGGICIVMAIPIFAPLGLLGSVVGYSIAVSCHRTDRDERMGLYGCIIMLPLMAMLETKINTNTIIEVRSQIVVQAPIETVWKRVIDFPDITAEPSGLLRYGIAYPIRARIDGVGIGAVRYCEFTTGSFVEPITTWDKPNRLAFDVTSQPEPMSELSPYRHIHPPHLDGTFRSVRGEFRLFELTDGATQLEGSTWYQLDIGPRVYWKLWTDWILHRIHDRVLDHVRQLAERDVGVQRLNPKGPITSR